MTFFVFLDKTGVWVLLNFAYDTNVSETERWLEIMFPFFLEVEVTLMTVISYKK
jgi:hypothetical protein